MTMLAQMVQKTPYVSYTYAYPHKTAYSLFPEPLSLSQLWSGEKRDALFLYMHIPFCEMRCGFCNLFTTVDPHARFEQGYLAAIERQAEQVHAAVGPVTIARMAIGGGTPTHLSLEGLSRLFAVAERLYGIKPGMLPTSVETSPLTAEEDKLRLLRARGVDRISIGVQSFIEEEAHAAGRPQQTAIVERALKAIREIGFPTLNIDLIYGLPGQTVESWLISLRTALQYRPEELYLYPLYVRPLTGLARRGEREEQEDLRLECYRRGRDLLLEQGYIQESMRMFRAAHAPTETGPIYCTQDDGMIGLGCGARSYTQEYHYSTEYAVGAQGVRAILSRYIATPAEEFALAHYGYRLDKEEQSRRYVLKSLLEAGGLDVSAYRLRFGCGVWEDRPELYELVERRLAVDNGEKIVLTMAGLEYSDAIGPWLYSAMVQERMGGFELR